MGCRNHQVVRQKKFPKESPEATTKEDTPEDTTNTINLDLKGLIDCSPSFFNAI